MGPARPSLSQQAESRHRNHSLFPGIRAGTHKKSGNLGVCVDGPMENINGLLSK